MDSLMHMTTGVVMRVSITSVMAKLGLYSATAIAEYAGLDRDTMRRRFREPKSFKLGEILTLTTKLRMGPESLECLTRGGKVS